MILAAAVNALQMLEFLCASVSGMANREERAWLGTAFSLKKAVENAELAAIRQAFAIRQSVKGGKASRYREANA